MSTPADDARGGSAPPRPASPGNGRQQWFVLGPWLFDITAATRLLHRAPRPAQPMPAGPRARVYGIIPGLHQPGTIALIGPGPGFDPQYAMTTSLDDPVIIATVLVPAGQPALLLIDGTHRLCKAALLGRTHIP